MENLEMRNDNIYVMKHNEMKHGKIKNNEMKHKAMKERIE